jgi:predicted PurR-regulated permease PerM
MKTSPNKRSILITNVVILIIIFLVVGAFWPTITGMFTPFFTAIVFAYLLNPLVRILEHRGLRRGAAVAIVVLGVFLLIVLIFWSFVPSLIASISSLVANMPDIISSLGAYSANFQEFVSKYNASKLAQYFDLQSSLSKAGNIIGNMLQSVSNSLLNNSGHLMDLIIIPLVTIMLLLDKEVFTNALMYLVPIDYRTQIKKMFCDIDAVIGGFIRGQGLMSIMVGLLTGFGAMVIGLPYAPVIGVIAGVTSMIPYFGPVVAAVIIGIMALLTGPLQMIYILVWIGIVQVVCGNVIAPALMAGDVGLHPVLIIFSIFFFGALFGGIGMILAVPLMGTVKVVLKYLVAGFAESQIELEDVPRKK